MCQNGVLPRFDLYEGISVWFSGKQQATACLFTGKEIACFTTRISSATADVIVI